jgi:hypothetical protein|tara:strand:+ start:128 stop:718 length:591 start_codon:yes stop_codon:yes gene_type:complete
MKTSESIIKISGALLAAQKDITFAGMTKTNPQFHSQYADLPSVIDAVKTPLNNNGIVFLQTCSPSEDDKLHLTTRLLHESGEWIEDMMVMPLVKSNPQGLGSAISYARRYSLAAITGLYQADDDGQAATAEKEPKLVTADAKKLSQHLENVVISPDLDSLRLANVQAYKFALGDQNALSAILKAKNARKKELTENE